MNDTSIAMQNKYHELLMQKTNEERFLMGFSMFETAREMVLASCQKNSSSLEKKMHLLTRFYGNDFSAKEMINIKAHLEKNEKKKLKE